MDWTVLGDWLESELRHFGDRLAGLSFGLIQALIVLLIARLVAGWVRRRIHRPRLIARLGVNLTSLLGNVAAIVIYVFALALALAAFGISLSALITYLSVTTLAVGLALQETLRNTIAGIYLLLERPFNIGDRVAVRDIRGRLENVELRTTSIRSDSGDLVLIPNSIVFTEIVTNRTATRSVRTRVEVTKLDLPPLEAAERTRAVVMSLDGLREPGPEVEVTGHTADGTTLRVSAWHDPDRGIRTDLVAALRDAFPACEVSSAPDA